MKKRSRRRPSSRQASQKRSFFDWFLLAVFAGLSGYLLFLVFRYGFLGFKALNLFLAAGLVVIFILAVLLISLKKAKWLTRLILILVSLLAGAGIVFGQSTVNFSNKLNQTARFTQVDMSIVVAVDSPVENPEDLPSLLTVDNDGDNVNKLLETLVSERALNLPQEQVSSYQEAYDRLQADKSKGMVLNSAYIGLLEAIDPNFSSKIKTIYSNQYQTPLPTKDVPDANADALNIYISGIDSYGPISGVSRSDVNIIMTINRKTKKILLTTTPRDSYLPIAGGGQSQMDKLTHAGIYGVDSSIETLENLYGIDIHYYARLNFTSFLNLIDVVGGVEVENDQEFVSHHSGVHYPAGQLSLNSQQALEFVRERYGLQGGDDDRGKNQTKVVAALIKKLSSADSLANYSAIIDGLSGSIQTDMPLSVMMELANGQLDSASPYQVTSVALAGSGSTGVLPSYAMPNASLYMVSIDEASLTQIKQQMQDVMEGR